MSESSGNIAASIHMPGSEERLRLRDGEVRYFRMGEGPPLLLLHGLGEGSIVWFDNIAPLAKSHTVFALDLPGHGESYKPLWERPLHQAVEFLSEFMDALGIAKASLVGNSLGGLLAIAMTLKHPYRIHRLVLENSAGLGREVAWFLRLISIPVLGEILASPSRTGIRRLLNMILHHRSVWPEALVEELFKIRRVHGNKESMLFMLRNGVSVRGVKPHILLTEHLHTIKTEVLVIWGRNDPLFPVSHAERAAKILPHSRLEVFTECGHWPHLEVRDEFNHLVSDFLLNGNS